MQTRTSQEISRNLLLDIIEMYSSDGYYKFGNIPHKKLDTAMQHFPINPQDTVLALIDGTVFGSAKVGMAIGLKGVYFKNDWTTPTDRNFLSWEELSSSPSKVGKGSIHCISLYRGCELNMSGCQMKKDTLANLLNQIVELFNQIKYEGLPQSNDTSISIVSSSNQAQHIQIENKLTDSNNDYVLILPEIIALCIVADGDINDSEVEMASSIIEHEDFITDKAFALELLMNSMDKLLTDKARSNAIFKLKANSIISKLDKLSHQSKERVGIIVDAMLDAVEDTSSDTFEMVNTIKKKLTQ